MELARLRGSARAVRRERRPVRGRSAPRYRRGSGWRLRRPRARLGNRRVRGIRGREREGGHDRDARRVLRDARPPRLHWRREGRRRARGLTGRDDRPERHARAGPSVRSSGDSRHGRSAGVRGSADAAPAARGTCPFTAAGSEPCSGAGSDARARASGRARAAARARSGARAGARGAGAGSRACGRGRRPTTRYRTRGRGRAYARGACRCRRLTFRGAGSNQSWLERPGGFGGCPRAPGGPSHEAGARGGACLDPTIAPRRDGWRPRSSELLHHRRPSRKRTAPCLRRSA